MKRIFLLALLALTFCRLFASPESLSPYSPPVVKAFADNLYDQGFYQEAESEYKRYFFMTQTFQMDAVFKVLDIYFMQKNKTGLDWMNKELFPFCSLEVQKKIDFVNAAFIFKERNQKDFSDFFNRKKDEGLFAEGGFLSKEILLFTVSQQILNKEIKEATQSLLTVKNKGEEETFSDFKLLYEGCQNYKLKSPGWALTFSAVIPGSGKWYSGNFWAGFSDLLGIASFTSAAVYYGKENGVKDWRVWTYGSMAALLYVVDLYGSYTGAQRYNQGNYNNLCKKVDGLYENLY